MFNARNRRNCSPIADHTDRSPECSRATSCPAAWAAEISVMIMSSDIGAVSTILAPAGQWLSSAFGTSDPANRHTGDDAIRSRPRMVLRSGAPGPAPMKCTVIRRLLPRSPSSSHHAPLHQWTRGHPAAHAAQGTGLRDLDPHQLAAMLALLGEQQRFGLQRYRIDDKPC